MRSLTNSVDPDEMWHITVFHLLCLSTLFAMLYQKQSSLKEIHFYVEILTCDSSVYTMDHPKFIERIQ